MGTDRLGRDVLSRVMVGSRDVLIVAPLAALLGVVARHVPRAGHGLLPRRRRRRPQPARRGVPGAAGRARRAAHPGRARHRRRSSSCASSGILFTPIVARTVRSAVLSERQLDYVTAAKLRGESGLFILSREIFPNVLGPTVVEMTVRFGYAIFTVATLSFLGVGLQPPSPDWGLTVSEEYTNMISGIWWPTLFPALAIASTVDRRQPDRGLAPVGA